MERLALLAPVPEEHLQDGLNVCATRGKVAFGSGKFDLFNKIDTSGLDQDLPVLIYPSASQNPESLKYKVSWIGTYAGFVNSRMGRHPDGMKFRPPSTKKYPLDNSGHWAIFWHVKDLKTLQVNQQRFISDFGKVKGGWRKNAPPRGPELVSLPSDWLEED